MKDKFRFFMTIAARLAAVAVLLFVSAPVARLGATQPLSGTNLLNNPGFEDGFSGGVAANWSGWGKDDGGYSSPGFDSSSTALSGSYAQKTSWRSEAAGLPMYGGLYQKVSGLTIGHAVSLSIWHNWPDDPQDGTQSLRVWIGLDPKGGTNPDSSDIVWTGDGQYASIGYQQLSVTTTAISTTVTAFIRAEAQYAKEAYVLWDDAILTSGPWQYAYLPLVARNYVPPCSLQNGGFEGDYAGPATSLVAPHWSPWWNDSYAKPEFNPTTCYAPGYPDCSRIRSDEGSQQYGINWKHYQGGVYQQLTGCTISETLRFSAYSLGYAARAIGSTTSDPDGEFEMKVGIDPSGGTDPTADGVIVWSEGAFSLDSFRRFEVTATVKSPTVTVFLYATSLHEPITEWYHNTTYWDDASLERLP